MHFSGCCAVPISEVRLANTSCRACSVVLGGWLLAGVVGLPLGIAMGWWRRCVDGLSDLPASAPGAAARLDPARHPLARHRNRARIFVVFIAAIVPWVMNSMQAVVFDRRHARARRADARRQRPQILTRVVCRTALPTLSPGRGSRSATPGRRWSRPSCWLRPPASATSPSTRRARSRWASCWWRWRSSACSARCSRSACTC